MSYELTGRSAPDQPMCRYGTSKLFFRGPKRDTEGAFIAFLGGGETFGRFVRDPFVALAERALKRNCVNLGAINAGLDSFVNDPEVLTIAKRAQATVLQVTGAHRLSNRYYRVHPRRNDRFVKPSARLINLYPEVDFTEFSFARHLLVRLQTVSASRFEEVRQELQQAWLGRMQLLLQQLTQPVLLLCLHYEAQDERAPLGGDPLFVTQDLLDQLSGDCAGVTAVQVKTAAQSDELGDMLFGTLQQPAAEHVIGPATHQIIADRVVSRIRDLDQ